TFLRRLRMLHDYLHFFGVTLFYYDHAITIGQEVNYLWKRTKRSSSYLFFANRYIPFFANMAITILTLMDLTPEVTRPPNFTLFRQVFLVVNQVFVSILLTLRIYALYECSRRMLTFMIGIGVTLIGAACWTLFSQKNTSALEGVVAGCHLGLDRETINLTGIAGAWEALFAYDCLIFTLTIRKTWKGRKNYAITGTSIPLVTLILRDGAIYFAIVDVYFNLNERFSLQTFFRGGLSTFSSAISITMMARLMLNLHESAGDGLLTTQTTSTNLDWEPQSQRGNMINFRSTRAEPSGLSEHDTQMLYFEGSPGV
ncbi:hypothetical protein CPC08DRAFT_642236, partial [Agrocybe pediades]